MRGLPFRDVEPVPARSPRAQPKTVLLAGAVTIKFLRRVCHGPHMAPAGLLANQVLGWSSGPAPHTWISGSAFSPSDRQPPAVDVIAAQVVVVPAQREGLVRVRVERLVGGPGDQIGHLHPLRDVRGLKDRVLDDSALRELHVPVRAEVGLVRAVPVHEHRSKLAGVLQALREVLDQSVVHQPAFAVVGRAPGARDPVDGAHGDVGVLADGVEGVAYDPATLALRGVDRGIGRGHLPPADEGGGVELGRGRDLEVGVQLLAQVEPVPQAPTPAGRGDLDPGEHDVPVVRRARVVEVERPKARRGGVGRVHDAAFFLGRTATFLPLLLRTSVIFFDDLFFDDLFFDGPATPASTSKGPTRV